MLSERTPDEPLAVKVETENWQTHTRIPAAVLAELVERIGGERDRYLVVNRIPDLPDVFVQVWHEGDGDYRLEHRAGAPMYGTNLAEPGPVVRAMTAWARQEDGWDAGLVWEPVNLPAPEEVPEPPREAREQTEARVRELLRCGYADRKTLSEAAADLRDEDDEPLVTKAQARRLVDRLWVERVAEQESWTGTTDPERLTQAFEALDADGITAREDFACCRGCGMAEIGAECADAGARGFVFFHRQCTESAAAGHGLSLYYGSWDAPDRPEERTAEVGQAVVTALTAAGLSTSWDGSPDRAIEVTDLDWRKRLTG
ncbi:DUF6891 domain-containing protein [Streptomyces sp. NPDC059786]|uniref:DUF6891 domain-containing protein n=1 Tax=Streptomyces sp. NPDC059786 TaxID=3346946 RepID=UPI0036597662